LTYELLGVKLVAQITKPCGGLKREAAEVTDESTEELLGRVRRLEAALASRPLDPSQAPSSEAHVNQAGISAGTVNTSGRDMYVVQLEERIRFLEGMDRAHRTRRVFFMLSGLALIVGLASASYVGVQISDLVFSAGSASDKDFEAAFSDKTTQRAAAVAGVCQFLFIAFLIMGLFSRPPRYR
jgi:hypothetical protein